MLETQSISLFINHLGSLKGIFVLGIYAFWFLRFVLCTFVWAHSVKAFDLCCSWYSCKETFLMKPGRTALRRGFFCFCHLTKIWSRQLTRTFRQCPLQQDRSGLLLFQNAIRLDIIPSYCSQQHLLPNSLPVNLNFLIFCRIRRTFASTTKLLSISKRCGLLIASTRSRR